MNLARGTVVAFDREAGFGEVEAEDGRRLFFHCSAVADGSRDVPVGADVVFGVVPGHRGRWEATSLVVAGGGRPASQQDQGAPSVPGAAPPP